MRVRDYFTVAVMIAGFGFAFLWVFPYNAFAYSHTGPIFQTAYDVQTWNMGSSVGPVYGSNTMDQLANEVPSTLYSQVAEASLLDLGSCLDCGMFNGTTIPTTSNFNHVVKVAAGNSNRVYQIYGGMPALSSTNVTSTKLCAVDPQYGGTSSYGSVTPSCGSGLAGCTALANSTQGIGCSTALAYSTMAFQLTGSCTLALNAGSGAAATVWLPDPAGDSATSGTPLTARNCDIALWSQIYSGWIAANALSGTGFFLTTQAGSSCESFAENFLDLAPGAYNTGAGIGCIAVSINEAFFSALYMHLLPVAFGSQSITDTVTLSPADTATPVQANLTNMRNYIDAEAINSQGASMTAQTTAIFNCLLDPADYQVSPSCPSNSVVVVPPTPGECVSLPQPGQNETAEDYRAQIRDESGYTGSIEFVDDTGYPSTYTTGSTALTLSADTVTGAIVTNLGIPAGEHQYTQFGGAYGAWKFPPPVVCPPSVGGTTDIQIIRVPSTYTPPTTIGSTGVGGLGGTSGTCGCGPVNFHPLTSINYGSKFPFGILTYVENLLSDGSSCTVGSGTCPGFMLSDITLTNPLTSGTTTIPMNATEGTGGVWNSTYRPIVFAVEDFIMTIAAVWFLGSKLFGIGSGAAAVDDE